MTLSQRAAVALAVACLSAACTTSGPEPTACATGQIACGTSCVAFLTDVNNCGGCGNVCPVPAGGGSAACALGQCQALCGAGQITCGGADAGEALTCASLDKDRGNCGGCGNACTATEVCSDSRCAPCPVAQCGNVCVDTQHDPANCGACGTACPGAQACVNGACGAPITITLLPPADGGFVSPNGQIEVSINSQFRLRGVTVDGPPVGQLPDGGPNTHSDLQLLGQFNDNPSVWALLVGNITLGQWDGGMIFTATDEVFRPDAGDAAQHQATLKASVQVISPPTGAGVTPTVSVSSGATALTFGSFVPLDSQPLTLTATFTNAPATVNAVNFISSLQGGIPTVAMTGNTATLTIDPTLLGLGNTVIQACAVDAAGDQVDFKLCSLGFNLTIGALPSGRAVETRDTDGGHALWFTNGDAGVGAQLLVSAPADAVNLGGLPSTAASDAGYFPGSVHEADTVNSVFAMRADDGGVDRFDCAGGCRTPGFIKGPGLTTIRAVTSSVVLLVNTDERDLVAPAAGGTAISPEPSGLASNITSFADVGHGALLLTIDTSADSNTPFEVVLYHPALSKPVQIGGAMNNGDAIVTAFPSGEFAVQYTTATASGVSSNFLVTGFFDGTTVKQTDPLAIPQLNGAPDFVPPQPGLLAGTIVKDATLSGLHLFIANPAANTVTFAVKPTCPAQIPANATCLGGIDQGATQTRLGIPQPSFSPFSEGIWQAGDFAISDDQQKILTVTEDLQNGQTSYSVWLVDVGTASAQQLYTTPLLVGGGGRAFGFGSAALAPHFLHAAPAAVGTIPGKAPAAALSAAPVVVFAELLESDESSGSGGVGGLPPFVSFPFARILYARYSAGNTVSPVVTVDQLTLIDGARPDLYVTSAAAQAVFFPGISPSGNSLNLFSAPLTGAASSASLVMDQISSYRVREDTSRILIARADGAIYGGKLAPSAAQRGALVPVLSDAFGGQPDPNNDDGNSYTPTMGFTPDGDHAWAYVQTGGSPFDFGTTAIVQVADLRNLARTNYGSAIFFIGSGNLPPIGFLGGSLAVGVDGNNFFVNQSRGGLFAAGAAAGTNHQLYSQPDNGFGGFVSSVDGTEGYVFGTFVPDVVQPKISATVFLSYFASADPSLYGGNFLLQVNDPGISKSQPATFSPYGTPYADAWNIFSEETARTGRFPTPLISVPATNALFYFKNWGGPASLPVALSTFTPQAFVMRQNSGNTEALMDFNDNSGSSYARRVKLNGIAPPVQPLP